MATNRIGFSTDFVLVNNKVGIGTTNPTSKLQVAGDVTAFDFYNDADYPNVRPTLDLAFAQTKILDSRITFTRASTATYVNSIGILTTAAVNEPRFDHNPTTGESLGLLVEEARTNLITYSQQFDNAAWGKPINTTVTANTHVAPDGTTTADTINAIDNQIIGNVAVTASTTYTVSVFIRKTTGATLFPMLVVNEFSSDQQRVLNTNTGQLVVRNAALNTGIQCESVGSYWHVSYSGNVGANTILDFLIYPAASTNGSNYSGGTGSIVAWGAQVEPGSFPTSYIPTTTATVTRSADVASMTGTNFSSWYNQNEGTLFAQARLNFFLSTSSVFPSIYQIGDYPNRLWALYLNNVVNILTIGADVHSRNLQTLTSSPQLFKVAQALSNTSLTYSASKDGATSLTGSLSSAVTNTTSLYIGGPNVGATKHIARLAYYPVRLTDTQLQALTAS